MKKKALFILSTAIICSLSPWTGRVVPAESVSAPVLVKMPDEGETQELKEEIPGEEEIRELQEEVPDQEEIQEFQEGTPDEGKLQEIQEEVPDAEEEKAGISDNDLSAAGGIPIDEAHFPDSVFRQYLATYKDENKDGILSEQEIKEINYIDFSYESDKGQEKIKSLKGIEYLTEVKSLKCAGNDLTSLDLRQNKKLEYLDCSWNRLKSLQIKGQEWLEEFDCTGNRLSHLDLSGIGSIYELYCHKNNLLSLILCDVDELYCYDNVLTELDLSNSPSVWYINCSENMLRSLDLSNNFLMKNKPPEDDDVAYDSATLICRHNRLESIKFAKDNDLGILYCENNRLTSLNVENLQRLNILECHGNKISTLDITKMAGLDVFYPDPGTKVTYTDTARLVSLMRGQKETKITWDYDGKICSGFSIYRKVGKGGWKKAGEIRKRSGKGRYSYTDKYTGKGNVTYTVAAFRILNTTDGDKDKGEDHQGAYDSKGLSASGVPSAPKNFRAAAGSKKVRLTWKKVSGSSGYHIYRKASKNAKWKKIADVKPGKASYIDKKAGSGKTYSYRIRAYKKGTGKDKSVVVNGIYSAVKKAAIR